MNFIKYLLFSLFILYSGQICAGNDLIKIDSVNTAFFIDESTPLPFSPVLSLKFGVPDTSFVIVEVHKIIEQECDKKQIKSVKIKSLINEELSKGVYIVNWDGTDQNGKVQSKDKHYIYYIKIERKTSTLYGNGFIKLEAKTKITSPP
jgi:hypothetical protein